MKKLLSREEELKKVFRYKGSKPILMYYRSDLFIHSKRVEWLSLEIADFLVKNTSKKLDTELIREMSRFHDDAEIIIGDYLSMDKEKFSKEKRQEYENNCLSAINTLYDNFGNLSDKFDYKDILLNIENRKGIEFFIVHFADKLDAHLEITHELFAGNKDFFNKLSHWGLDVGPFDYTRNKLLKIRENILDYFGNDLDLTYSFLDLSSDFDDKKIIDNSEIHNIENIKLNKGYQLYDNRVKLHFKYGNKNDINYLVNKREN